MELTRRSILMVAALKSMVKLIFRLTRILSNILLGFIVYQAQCWLSKANCKMSRAPVAPRKVMKMTMTKRLMKIT
jgi:hypothetical protein